MPNRIHSDVRLSLEARGMLGLLMSMAPGWVFRAANLREQAGGIGRDKYRRIINEIKDAGYLEVKTSHDDDGRFIGTSWVIHDTPPQDVETEGLKIRPTVKCTEGLKNRPPENTAGRETRPLKKNNLSKNNKNKICAFDAFWAVWPNKSGKADAKAAFAKMSDEDRADATRHAARWFTDWRKKYPTASPILPASFLRKRRWEDETEKTAAIIDPESLQKAHVKAIKSGLEWMVRDLSSATARDLVYKGLVTHEECRKVGLRL